MDRMSPLDSAFLDSEDENPATGFHIGAVVLLDGPAPPFQDVVTAIAAKLLQVPRYRQKLRFLPFDLGPPVWVDDPAFDIGNHVHHSVLPAPGDDEQLRALVGRLMSWRLDRRRPLWENWVVEGLAGGRWALVLKTHHCMVDGVSATTLFDRFFAPAPAPALPRPREAWNPRPEPCTLSLSAEALWTLALNPVHQLRTFGAALLAPRALATRVRDTGRGLVALARAGIPANASSLFGPIGPDRRFVWARSSLADTSTVRRAFGGTVNDVLLAAISGGFRGLLEHRGEPLGPHTVRTMVPVSVRAPCEDHIYENRVAILLADLPVHIADPVQRLAAVRAQMIALKASKVAEAGETLTSLACHEPYPLVALGLRSVAYVPHRSVVTVATNVPGPRRQLYLLDRPVRELIPYCPIANKVRIAVAILTYNGQVSVGITGDHASTADLDVLARGIEDGVAALLARAQAARPKTRPAARAEARAAARTVG
ncbi:MAG: wax ester/triacylglycerol synthase family O-acyltransferase [Frankiaceae bacterium]